MGVVPLPPLVERFPVRNQVVLLFLRLELDQKALVVVLDVFLVQVLVHLDFAKLARHHLPFALLVVLAYLKF